MDLPIIKRRQVAAEITRRLFGKQPAGNVVAKRARVVSALLARRRADIRADVRGSAASSNCAWMSAMGFLGGLARAIYSEPAWIPWCTLGLGIAIGIAINQRAKRRAFLSEFERHEDPTIEEETHRIKARLRELHLRHPTLFPAPK